MAGTANEYYDCLKFKDKLYICNFREGLIAINRALQLLVNSLPWMNITAAIFLIQVFPVFPIGYRIWQNNFFFFLSGPF